MKAIKSKCIFKGVILIALLLSAIMTTQFMYTVYLSLGGFEPSKEKVIQKYDKCSNEVECIGNYLIKLNYDYLAWYSYDNMYIVQSTNDENIDIDVEMRKYFDKIHEGGFKTIIKEDNNIVFVRWSSLDASSGVVFSLSKPNLDWYGNLKIEKLKNNIYYFYHYY